MSPPLDELYFPWLYSLVGSTRIADPSKTHWNLLRQLYNKEFVWFIPNDDNRAKDGRDLREEFIRHEGLFSVDRNWMDLGCSMLELFIGLSRRAAFETGWPRRRWFWEIMSNLLLDGYHDAAPLPERKIDDILDCVIWRLYADDGTGGPFPVKGQRDMQQMELWYQLQAYMIVHCGY